MPDKYDLPFLANTKYEKIGNRHSVKCKKGLWGVEGPTKKGTYQEAKHYFIQYYRDGEYN